MGENTPITLTCTPTAEIKKPWGKLVSCLPTLDSIVIDKPSLRIGRAPHCDVIINRNNISPNELSSISKEHCIITKDPTDANTYLTDVSKNGSYVNGRLLKRNRVILNDNDKIAIGNKSNNVFVFQSLPMAELPETLSQSVSNSSTVVIGTPSPTWGRLISCILHLSSFDLYEPTFKVGRASQCKGCINNMDIDEKMKTAFSKEHFLIVKDADNCVTYIEDLSKTGTYLNGNLIGKNNKNILQNDDIIGITAKKTGVFVYKSMYSSDTTYLPPELRKKYELSTVLGKGGCGEDVPNCGTKQCTCKMYAIKKILKSRSTTSQMHRLNHPSKIRSEINILQSLSHPFVISMKEIVETQEEVFIVLDYMKGGELSNRIFSMVPLTESNIKFLFYQIMLAVQYLHSQGITHRDLKPENVLLCSDEIETLVKVADFGLSKVTDDEELMRTMCGTPYYVAPEILDVRIKEYDKQVDIWSLGVILFYMLSKKLPFKSPDRRILSKLIISGTYDMDDSTWNGISHLAKDLVRRMLKVDPQERITVNGVLKHPWLAKDVPMQYRVQAMVETILNAEDNETVAAMEAMEPPLKRIRLSSSDDSSN